MTTRRRSIRRRRIWTTTNVVELPVSSGVNGQKAQILDANFALSTGLAGMFGCTISRTHVCTLLTSIEDATSIIKMQMGIGIFPTGTDEGDFPNLQRYEGDWLAYECFVFQLPGGTAQIPVVPSEAAFTRSDYRSMRKVTDVGMSPFIVFQTDSASDFEIDAVVSQLILLP